MARPIFTPAPSTRMCLIEKRTSLLAVEAQMHMLCSRKYIALLFTHITLPLFSKRPGSKTYKRQRTHGPISGTCMCIQLPSASTSDRESRSGPICWKDKRSPSFCVNFFGTTFFRLAPAHFQPELLRSFLLLFQQGWCFFQLFLIFWCKIQINCLI